MTRYLAVFTLFLNCVLLNVHVYVLGSGRGQTEVSVNTADSGNFTCTASNVFLERGIERTTRLVVYCKTLLVVIVHCKLKNKPFSLRCVWIPLTDFDNILPLL